MVDVIVDVIVDIIVNVILCGALVKLYIEL